LPGSEIEADASEANGSYIAGYVFPRYQDLSS